MSQRDLTAKVVAIINAALAALNAAKRGDHAELRRELRGLAERLAVALDAVDEGELAGVIQRTLWVTSGLDSAERRLDRLTDSQA